MAAMAQTMYTGKIDRELIKLAPDANVSARSSGRVNANKIRLSRAFRNNAKGRSGSGLDPTFISHQLSEILEHIERGEEESQAITKSIQLMNLLSGEFGFRRKRSGDFWVDVYNALASTLGSLYSTPTNLVKASSTLRTSITTCGTGPPTVGMTRPEILPIMCWPDSRSHMLEE